MAFGFWLPVGCPASGSRRANSQKLIAKSCRPRRAAAAQVLQQNDHLMFLVGGATRMATSRRLLVARNPFSPLCPRSAGTDGRIENAGAQESSDELQLIRGQAPHETAGPGFMRTIGARNESGYQSTSHGRSPDGEKSYSYTDSGRIMSKSAARRKGQRLGAGRRNWNLSSRYRRLTEYWRCNLAASASEKSPEL